MKVKTEIRFLVLGILVGIAITISILLYTNHLQIKHQLLILQNEKGSDIEISPTSQEEENGKININSASKSELATLPGIGEVKAKAIVEFRQKYGPYEDISELAYVAGIGNNLIDSIKTYISIE